MDRPGHGWSDRPGGPSDASPERQAELIAEALDVLRITRAVVVGHSLGGTVATAFALAYPRRTSGLVLLAAVTPSVARRHRVVLQRSPARDGSARCSRDTLALPLGTAAGSARYRECVRAGCAAAGLIRGGPRLRVLRPTEFIDNAADVACALSVRGAPVAALR